MAWIETRTLKNGSKSYDLNWYDPQGERCKVTFKKWALADHERKKIEYALAMGSYIDPKAGKKTFEAFVTEDWLPFQTAKSRTVDQYRRNLRLHVLPTLGKVPMADIRSSHIKKCIKAFSHLAPTTQAQIKGMVTGILDSALDDDLVKKNVAKGKTVKTAPKVKRNIKAWSTETVGAMYFAIPRQFRLMVLLGSGAGLRQSEIFGLSPVDVDWDANVIHVRRQVAHHGNALIFALPKFDKEREVPMSPMVAEALRTHIETYPPKRVTLPWDDADGKPVTASLVLTSRESGALDKDHINSYYWKKALRTLGLDAEDRYNMMHALRHYYASSLLADGESILAVQQNMGHEKASTTLDLYGHMMPGATDKSRAAVDKRFATFLETGDEA